MAKDNEYGGYEVRPKAGLNYEIITAQNFISSKKLKLPIKYSDRITLTLNEHKELLKQVAKEEGKRYHTLATELIISGIKRLEKNHQKKVK